MYVIRFTKGSRVRYATKTRGDPEYNAIDTAHLSGAKTWKTRRGADNYLKFTVLLGRTGQRIRTRWSVIEVVEIDLKASSKTINQNQPIFAMAVEPLAQTEHTKKILLLEIEELRQSLQNISHRLEDGKRLGNYTVDASKINNLIGRFQLLTELYPDTASAELNKNGQLDHAD